MRWYWLVLFWILAALVMASHRPSSLLHAQFWAEDGYVWYQQAYQQGPLLPLTHSQDGYFQTLPRLIAAAALPAPLHHAPLVMNVLALLIQGLPVVFLLSRRGEHWGSLPARAALALLYLCLPNSAEWHANTTNTQWVLALLAGMVLLARLPAGWLGKAGDLIVLGLSGFTGPFCILLLPVAAVMAWLRRERWRWTYLLVIVISAACQGYSIFITRNITRTHQPLDASVSLLVRILAAHIFAGSVLGTLSPLDKMSVPLLLPLAITCISLLLLVVGLWHAPLELRLFTLFAAEVMAAALHSSMVSLVGPQWPAVLGLVDARYYLFPMLAFLLCTGCVALHTHKKWLRGIAVAVLCLLPLGIAHNWQDYAHSGLFDRYSMIFPAEARRFEAAPPGTRMSFPIQPNWRMTLTKH